MIKVRRGWGNKLGWEEGSNRGCIIIRGRRKGEGIKMEEQGNSMTKERNGKWLDKWKKRRNTGMGNEEMRGTAEVRGGWEDGNNEERTRKRGAE